MANEDEYFCPECFKKLEPPYAPGDVCAPCRAAVKDFEGAAPVGPTYESGDCKVVYLGWLDNDGNGTAGMRAVIEFPSGPPKLPMSVVWDGTPCTLTIKSI